MDYDFRKIEEKWRKKWADENIYHVTEDKSKPKYYVLNMFPYPSGAGLHVGHPLGYIASDIYARYKRLRGFNVLNPMGYDAYGLPAEQYAIQTGQHPAVTTVNNINRYREQLDKIGFSFDWDREVRTCDPSYYKWTQWAFILMFRSYYSNTEKKARPIDELVKHFEQSGTAGIDVACSEELEFSAAEWNAKSDIEKQQTLMNYRIAYLGETEVNWCAQLGTVLANDEVVDGVSVRGGYPVVQKKMKQWCLRVSAYAQRLLDGLDTIDWTDSIKETQRNWIGRSEGTEVEFSVKGSDKKFTIFTTRADTMFGVTFMVLAPESDLALELTTAEQKAKVEEYIDTTKRRTERERIADRKVTGVFTGSYAINPFTGDEIPIWVSDYVLAGYGTGAIMAVPAHDSRDYAFAKHFNLPIIPLIEGCDVSEQSFDAKDGIVTNSPRKGAKPYIDFSLNGLTVKEAIAATKKYVSQHHIGRVKVNYRLRDAIFSRQRYWGEPFPVIHMEDGSTLLVPEADLPLTLPVLEDYKPTGTGEPPLAKAKDWVNYLDPKTGARGRRETNTMPQWAGSCWYYLRYIDPHNDTAFADPALLRKWLPVDLYVGGAEHAVLHLLYSRFWHKVLFDLGLVPTSEPFRKLVNQGMILGLAYKNKRGVLVPMDEIVWKDGKPFGPKDPEDKSSELEELTEFPAKMSKSLKNVVNPDDVIRDYGADSLRLYEMFMGPLQAVKPWNTKGVDGVFRFLKRVNKMVTEQPIVDRPLTKAEAKTLNATIKKVDEDLAAMNFNTGISAMMVFINAFAGDGKELPREAAEKFVLCLAPFAPHLGEELWQFLGHTDTLAYEPFPAFDAAALVEDEVEIPVQVLGKLRGRVKISVDADAAAMRAAAESNPDVAKYLEGKTIVKVICVPKKMVNFVVR